MNVISNAGPLIALGKLNWLGRLDKVYSQVQNMATKYELAIGESPCHNSTYKSALPRP
jgi:hypothetical protein